MLRRRHFAIDLGAGAGRQPLHVEQILHREWHTGQRSDRLAGGAVGIERIGAGQRTFGGDIGEGIQNLGARADSGQRVFDHLPRTHLAARNRSGDHVALRKTGIRHGQASNTGAGSASSGSGK